MPITLVETPGLATANTFATVEEFRDYQATRYPQLAWVATATDDTIAAILVMAGRALNGNFDWTGAAVDSVQAMTWPRVGMATRNGFSIATTIIPTELKNAQCELAGQMGAADLVSDNDALKQGISSVKAGSVAVAFQSIDTSSVDSVDMALRRLGSEFNYISSEIPGEVRRLLVPSWFNQPTIIRDVVFEAF
jgi:Zn-dependent alcohol dehydrogenase